MFDAVSLDQLRTFIAAADEGSFLGGRPPSEARPVRGEPDAGESGRATRGKLFDRSARFRC